MSQPSWGSGHLTLLPVGTPEEQDGRGCKQFGLRVEGSSKGAEPTPGSLGCCHYPHHDTSPYLVYVPVKVRSDLVLQSSVTDDLSGHVGTLGVHLHRNQPGCARQQSADADSRVATIRPQLQCRRGRRFQHDGVQNGSWTGKVASCYCETQ